MKRSQGIHWYEIYKLLYKMIVNLHSDINEPVFCLFTSGPIKRALDSFCVPCTYKLSSFLIE